MERLGVGQPTHTALTPWPKIVLGDVVEFLRRGIHSRAELGANGSVRNVHYGDIHTSTRAHLDAQALRELPTLNENQAGGLDRLLDGDVVFTDASEDLDGVAKAVELTNVGDTPVVAGMHTIAARFDKAVLEDGFKGYLQFVPEFRTQIRRLAAGTKVYGITRSHVAAIELSVPPPPEQRAIAHALSDADALLQRLAQLIAKKHDLRIAVMQQLLSGQSRLPGFNDAWKERVLGEHVRFLKNGANPRADLRSEGRVRYLHYGDIHTSVSPLLDVSIANMPRLPESLADRIDRLENGDLVFVDASEDLSGVGKSVEISGASGLELVAGLHTIAARFDKDVLADGFKGYLQFCRPFRDQLARLAQGTKVFATTRPHIASVVMKLPGIAEQEAIANVLSESERELLALAALRKKTTDVKLAMMQELLTGKTRLHTTGDSIG